MSEAFRKDTPIEVYNLLGQKVFTSLIERDQLSKSLDLSNLQGGTYILKVGDGVDRVIKRIVKF